MNGIPLKEGGFEVLDSTDWLATPLPKLSAVEAALRCQVCKDFYASPMITTCCHTFCSLCIRRALSENGLCPFCRAPDQEIRLRLNNSVYDLVEAFKAARPEILEYASQKPALAVRTASPKRRREDTELDHAQDGPSAKRTRSSRRLAQTTGVVQVLDSDDGDEDFTPEEGMVQCPICEKQVKQDMINSHLDRGCADEPPKPRTGKISSIRNTGELPQKVAKKPERLAPLNYSMVKEPVLKKKLSEQGLSAMGSRQILERRYTEWVTLWNANCDARLPKGKNELKKELELWERTQGARAQASGSINPGAQIKDKDFDGKAWASKHDDSFRELIANARRKLPTKPSAPPSNAIELEPSISRSFPHGQLPKHAESKSESVEAGHMSQKAPDEFQAFPQVPDGSQGPLIDGENDCGLISSSSSQLPNGITTLEKDACINLDMTTSGSTQP